MNLTNSNAATLQPQFCTCLLNFSVHWSVTNTDFKQSDRVYGYLFAFNQRPWPVLLKTTKKLQYRSFTDFIHYEYCEYFNELKYFSLSTTIIHQRISLLLRIIIILYILEFRCLSVTIIVKFFIIKALANKSLLFPNSNQSELIFWIHLVDRSASIREDFYKICSSGLMEILIQNLIEKFSLKKRKNSIRRNNIPCNRNWNNTKYKIYKIYIIYNIYNIHYI